MTIETLKAQLNVLKIEVNSKIDALVASLQSTFDAMFDADDNLQKALIRLDQSNDYMWVDSGDIAAWLRFDFTGYADDEKYLKTYLQERHCIAADFDNGVLMQYWGPALVINHEGDILDQASGKWPIKKASYTDDDGKCIVALRNELLENYMEKTGCYPGVFITNRQGDIKLVDTQKKE